MNKPFARSLALAVLLPLALLLTACSAPLKPSTGVVCPPPPAMPQLPDSLKKPPPQESFLEAAQQRIESWRNRLTDSATR